MKTSLFRKYRRVHQINASRDTDSSEIEVGQPGDAYEREADAVADSVVLRPATAGKTGLALGAQPKSAIQMKCAACEQESLQMKAREEEEEQKVRMKPVEEEEEEKIQMKPALQASATNPLMASAETAHRIASSKGQGTALPAPVNAEMGSKIGADFSDVRIHTDSQSVQLSDELGAQAFTHGQDIYFNAGKYNPASTSGKHLLAHELTHVVQQNNNTIRTYRERSSPNFGACNTTDLKEKQFKDEKKDPWIETITIDFTGVTTDSDKNTFPTGTLAAKYKKNEAALPDIMVGIVGGKAKYGLTDIVNAAVERIEGCGYHHTAVPKKLQIKGHKRKGKYFKPEESFSATMNFAIFFLQGPKTGNQAIHEGSLSMGSLACVHVEAQDIIRQLNYHSRVGKTTVKVSYSDKALHAACCARFNETGKMVSNPCKGVDKKKC